LEVGVTHIEDEYVDWSLSLFWELTLRVATVGDGGGHWLREEAKDLRKRREREMNIRDE